MRDCWYCIYLHYGKLCRRIQAKGVPRYAFRLSRTLYLGAAPMSNRADAALALQEQRVLDVWLPKLG